MEAKKIIKPILMAGLALGSFQYGVHSVESRIEDAGSDLKNQMGEWLDEKTEQLTDATEASVEAEVERIIEFLGQLSIEDFLDGRPES